MTPTPAETAERERVDREARLQAELTRRGQTGAAERYTNSVRRQAELNPENYRLSRDQLLNTLNNNDRNRLAAQLRAQANYARERINREKAKKNGGKSKEIRYYEKMARESDRAANTIATNTGPFSQDERLLAGSTRDPDANPLDIKRTYATGELQERADRAQDRIKAVDREIEKTGFTGTRTEYINQQRTNEATAQRQAAKDQRQYYEATGGEIPGPFGTIAKERGYKSPITPAQQRAAQTAMVREGKATLTDPITGRQYQELPGQPNILYNIRTPQEQQTANLYAAKQQATQGTANYQGTDGRTYFVEQPKTIYAPEPTPDNNGTTGSTRPVNRLPSPLLVASTTAAVVGGPTPGGAISFLTGRKLVNPETATRYLTGISNVVVPPIRGAIKILSQTQPVPSPVGNLPIPKGRSTGERLQTLSTLANDPDIKATAGAAAVIGLQFTPASPVVNYVALPGAAAFQTVQTIKDPTPENFGELTVTAIPAYAGVRQITRQLYIRTGSKPVPIEELAPQVSVEGKNFPKTTSPQDTIQQFQNTKDPTGTLKGYHTTQSSGLRDSGKITSPQDTQPVPFEDPGLFIAPEVSPYFTGLLKKPTAYEIGFFKGTSPQILRLDLKGVQRQPPEVLQQPGFKETGKFLQEQAGSAVAYVTKRSEAAFNPAIRSTIKRGGSTTEAEAVIRGNIEPTPPASIIGRIKGFEEYTVINGEAVPIYGLRFTSQPTTQTTSTVNTLIQKTGRYDGTRYIQPGTTYFSTTASTTDSNTSSTPPTIKPSRPTGYAQEYRPTPSPRPTPGVSITPRTPEPTPRQPTPDPRTPEPTPRQPTPDPRTPEPTPRQPTPDPDPRRPDPEPRRPGPERDRPEIRFSTKKDTAPLFSVEVRRQGQFRTFTTQGLRLDEAVRLGQTITDTTAARSFKIVEQGTARPITGDTRAQAQRLLTPGRYREAKTDKNIFVERSRFAINTPGEKLEINPKRGVFGETTQNSPFRSVRL